MNVSSSSKAVPDPLSDALLVLGATVSRRTRLEASGDWALAFPALDRLKFVAFLRGAAWIILPGAAAQRMIEGDVCLLGRTPYGLASDPGVEPVDGQAFYVDQDVARIGGSDTIVLGGTVSFGVENASFLLDRLPDFLLVPRSSAASGAIATILALMDGELARSTIGGEIVSARLADILLVEAIRAFSHGGAPVEIGWLGALSDPRLGRALYAIHGDVAHPWTVDNLAGVAGMSRAAFAAEFTRRVGQPPLAYVRTWRMTIARAALTRGDVTISSIAGMVGYSSLSAFAFAFRSAFGLSPRAYARQ
ncbi:AraC family transcriptional regulator [Sphingomonas koreensis]|nr:AraC family transcriptional regulator [Sphingomonas koreensis]